MIEIKISGNTPLEALASLTAFGYRCMSNPEVSAAANRIYEAEQKAEEKKATTADIGSGHTPQEPAPAVEENPTPPQEPAPAVEENPTPPPAPPSTAPSAPAGQSPDGSAAGASPEPITPSDPTPAKAPTLEEVRDIGIKYSKQYGAPAIKAILTELGASGMGALAEDQRPIFLAKLTELGPLKEDKNNA